MDSAFFNKKKDAVLILMICKVGQDLLQSETVVTKWGSCYKVGHNNPNLPLQSCPSQDKLIQMPSSYFKETANLLWVSGKEESHILTHTMLT